MPVTVYKSTDVGAPVLNNTAGSLVAVMDACLVNGIGAKPGAGWTKEYSLSTTGASYKQGTGSNGRYLNVDDSLPSCARARGFESMSAYNAGGGLFPLDGQQAGATYFQKTNNAVANQIWMVVANQKMFYYFSSYDANATFVNGTMFIFGDFISEKSPDPFSTVIMGAVGTTNTNAASNAPSTSYLPYFSFTEDVHGGCFVPRTYSGLGSSVQVGKHVNMARLGRVTNASWLSSYGLTSGAGGVLYPSPPNGGLYLSPIWVHEQNFVRGRLPGIYLFASQSTKPNHGDTYTGSGDMAGKTFVCANIWNAQFHIETTDTW